MQTIASVLTFLKQVDAEGGRSTVDQAVKQLKRYRKTGGVEHKRKPMDKKIVARAAERRGGVCPRCRKPYTKDNPATGDHVQHRIGGGAHDETNIDALCKKCNSSKNDNDLLTESKKSGRTLLEMQPLKD
jgi:5-methylcytosine-specific restriction endonuclease McrA